LYQLLKSKDERHTREVPNVLRQAKIALADLTYSVPSLLVKVTPKDCSLLKVRFPCLISVIEKALEASVREETLVHCDYEDTVCRVSS